jgi:putative DNA primase/helicase
MSADDAVACALWVVHTYGLDAVSHSPRLSILSPIKRCGKTTLLTVLKTLVQRPILASHVTAPSFFRTTDAHSPSWLLDEADTYLTKSQELIGALNAGYSRESAQVVRLVGDDYTSRLFSTWAPVAIAGIGQLPTTLEDRSIVISLRRRLPGETVTRLDHKGMALLGGLASQAARWVQDNLQNLKDCNPSTPAGLNDRSADHWRPLLAIADCAGGLWPECARRAAIALEDAKPEEESPLVQLLVDIRDIISERTEDDIPSANLVKELVKKEDRPWKTFNHGREITQNQIASLLSPLKLKTRNVRFPKEGVLKSYRCDSFRDAFARYIPADADGVVPAETSATPLQSHHLNGLDADAAATPAATRDDETATPGADPPPHPARIFDAKALLYTPTRGRLGIASEDQAQCVGDAIAGGKGCDKEI